MEDKPPLAGCELGNMKKKNLMQRNENISYFWTLLQYDEVATTLEERINLSENKNPTIIIEDIYEPCILASGKEEANIHEGKRRSLQDNCSIKEGNDFPQEIHSFS